MNFILLSMGKQHTWICPGGVFLFVCLNHIWICFLMQGYVHKYLVEFPVFTLQTIVLFNPQQRSTWQYFTKTSFKFKVVCVSGVMAHLCKWKDWRWSSSRSSESWTKACTPAARPSITTLRQSAFRWTSRAGLNSSVRVCRDTIERSW